MSDMITSVEFCAKHDLSVSFVNWVLHNILQTEKDRLFINYNSLSIREGYVPSPQELEELLSPTLSASRPVPEKGKELNWNARMKVPEYMCMTWRLNENSIVKTNNWAEARLGELIILHKRSYEQRKEGLDLSLSRPKLIKALRVRNGFTRSELSKKLSAYEDSLGIHAREEEAKGGLRRRKNGEFFTDSYIEDIEKGHVGVSEDRFIRILKVVGVSESETNAIMLWSKNKSLSDVKVRDNYREVLKWGIKQEFSDIRAFHRVLYKKDNSITEKALRKSLSGESPLTWKLHNACMSCFSDELKEIMQPRLDAIKYKSSKYFLGKLEESESFAEFMFICRLKSGLNSTEFASHLGLKQKAAVSSWERGERVPLEKAVKQKIAEVSGFGHDMANKMESLIAEHRQGEAVTTYRKLFHDLRGSKQISSEYVFYPSSDVDIMKLSQRKSGPRLE